MNEKLKKNIHRFIGIIICFVHIYLTGCQSSGKPVDNSIIEHQRRITELEGRVNDYERRLAEYDNLITGTQSRLEAIRARADSFTDRIDRIIFLFSEYEREVQRLLDEGNSIRSQDQSASESNILAGTGTDNNVGAENSQDNPWLR